MITCDCGVEGVLAPSFSHDKGIKIFSGTKLLVRHKFKHYLFFQLPTVKIDSPSFFRSSSKNFYFTERRCD